MAIVPREYYWIYQLQVSEEELAQLDEHIGNGRAEYVAGELLGRLKSNSKMVFVKKPEESKLNPKPLERGRNI